MKTECGGCGRQFGGTVAFDRHRWGPYTGDPKQDNAGRCHDPSEAGLKKVDGVWRQSPPSLTPQPGNGIPN